MYLRIKELMKKKGVSSMDISKALGKSSTQTSFIINEKSTTSLDNYKKIADLLGVGLNELFVQERKQGSNIINGYVKIGDNIKELSSISDLIDATREATEMLSVIK